MHELRRRQTSSDTSLHWMENVVATCVITA